MMSNRCPKLIINSIKKLPRPVVKLVCYFCHVLLIPYRFLRFKQLRARKDKLKQIVVIGDSHSAFFSGNSDGFDTKILVERREFGSIQYEKGIDFRFCVLRLGPGLAYNTNRYGTNTKSLEKYEWLRGNFLRVGDRVIFVFGEIDIRTRVYKYDPDKRNYQETIDSIVKNYMQFLLRAKKDGLSVWAWGPIASQKDEWAENDEFPRCGNEVQRNIATRYFNSRLKQECDNNGIGFISILDDIMDEDYKTKDEYILDYCHLNQKARPFLEKLIFSGKLD